MSNNSAVFPHETAFHSKTLLLIEHSGAPFVPIDPVIKVIGLKRNSRFVNRAINKFKGHLIQLNVTLRDGKTSSMECLPLRKISAWLMAFDTGRCHAANADHLPEQL